MKQKSIGLPTSSGQITIAAAETGVNLISIGALTHSSKALDISLDLEPQTIKIP